MVKAKKVPSHHYFQISFLLKGFIYLKENKKILLATSNKGKLEEFQMIFSNYEIISQADLGIFFLLFKNENAMNLIFNKSKIIIQF